MALNPPVPGLRLVQKRNNVAKVALVVPAGDELVVSPEVAAQLLATGDFVDVAAAPKAAAEPAPEAPAAPADEAPKGKKKA